MPIPYSTYLTSFVVGKYVKVADSYGDLPLGFYVYPGKESIARTAFGRTKDMIQAFEELTGVKFPYNKYDQTIVRGFQFGGSFDLDLQEESAALHQPLPLESRAQAAGHPAPRGP